MNILLAWEKVQDIHVGRFERLLEFYLRISRRWGSRRIPMRKVSKGIFLRYFRYVLCPKNNKGNSLKSGKLEIQRSNIGMPFGEVVF